MDAEEVEKVTKIFKKEESPKLTSKNCMTSEKSLIETICKKSTQITGIHKIRSTRQRREEIKTFTPLYTSYAMVLMKI